MKCLKHLGSIERMALGFLGAASFAMIIAAASVMIGDRAVAQSSGVLPDGSRVLWPTTRTFSSVTISSEPSITVIVNGPIDGSQQSITKTYALTPQQFTGLIDLNRMDFCPKEPVNPANPNGPAKSTITDAQVIGCFTDFLAIGTMQRITAHAREVARGDATGR